MATRVTYPIFKAFTASGTFGVGYKLYTYEAGTDTLLTVYKNEAGTIAHTNPILLNAKGEEEIFINQAAKFTLTDADGNVQTGWPVDNIDPSTITAAQVGCTPSGSVSSDNVQDALDEIITEVDSLRSDVDDLSDAVDTLSDINALQDYVYGGDITVSGATMTITPCRCIDSTRAVLLQTTANKTVTIPTVNNQGYYIFIVKLLADSSCEFRAYTTYAGVASDTAVSHYAMRAWWQNNSSGAPKAGYVRDGILTYLKPSENYINSMGIPPANFTTSISLSTFLPDAGKFKAVGFGVHGTGTTSAVSVGVSSVSGYVEWDGYAGYSYADDSIYPWGNSFGTGYKLIRNKTTTFYWGKGSDSTSLEARLLLREIQFR